MAGSSPAKGIFGCECIVADNLFPSAGQQCVCGEGRTRGGTLPDGKFPAKAFMRTLDG